MTRAAEVEGTPRAHLATPSHWPHGEIDKKKDHPSARYAQRFAAGLAEVIGSRSLRSVARQTGVSHGTVSALLRGDTWPDLVTVSKLEWHLGHVLWPGPLLFAEQVRGLRVMQADYERSVARRARFYEA
jgi:hypothetical protein